eukprot:CAMPEP_0117017060 /NCGR_PEP_ID=MMETSP0472-20121206/13381_1 /TAXON_ID=693140 ORGANISM="Tiarina fusus, Strain LIS" /NCGR_SAMPLE_ID=MMETSP0472 /ASSEMBLY_ACC=CAM_ASM_000603 /LENGTH=136 /DNA_ID=CAMNT_0004721333 /DNA_START=694 /DNA_END=1101 /DNA_ORIENTATION=-
MTGDVYLVGCINGFYSKKFVLIDGLPEIEQVFPGILGYKLLDIDGNLWLFDGDNIKKVEEVSMITSVSRGGNHSIVGDRNGDVWVFGTNQNGQLGLGFGASSRKPVQDVPIKTSQKYAKIFKVAELALNPQESKTR